MTQDDLKNFTVRFPESLLKRIGEVGRAMLGSRANMSETIRMLAQERVEEYERHHHEIEPKSARLARILKEWRTGRPLEVEDLRFIANHAHSVYLHNRPTCVSRKLLLDNVNAFSAIHRLMRQKQNANQRIEESDRYYLSNLSCSKVIQADTVQAYVERWLALLPAYPTAHQAEFAARNLSGLLRSEEVEAYPIAHLNVELSPFIASLLQLAIREHWYSTREPLLSISSEAHDSQPVFANQISDGEISLMPMIRAHELMVMLSFGDRGLMLSVNSFPEICDLQDVILRGANNNFFPGDIFSLLDNQSAKHDQDPKAIRAMLAVDRFRLNLTADMMASLQACVDQFMCSPPVASLCERLAYVYGRI